METITEVFKKFNLTIMQIHGWKKPKYKEPKTTPLNQIKLKR